MSSDRQTTTKQKDKDQKRSRPVAKKPLKWLLRQWGEERKHARHRGRVKQHEPSETLQAQAQNRQTRLPESGFPAPHLAEARRAERKDAEINPYQSFSLQPRLTAEYLESKHSTCTPNLPPDKVDRTHAVDTPPPNYDTLWVKHPICQRMLEIDRGRVWVL